MRVRNPTPAESGLCRNRSCCASSSNAAYLFPPKTRSTAKNGLFTGASKGRGAYRAGAGSRLDGGANLGKVLFPPGRSLRGSQSTTGRKHLSSVREQFFKPPYVAVMQSADLRQFNDRPQLRWLNRSGLRCIFLQRQVRAGPIIIIEV